MGLVPIELLESNIEYGRQINGFTKWKLEIPKAQHLLPNVEIRLFSISSAAKTTH